MDWCIPTFDGELYWEWPASRMHNYMVHFTETEEWKPRYYDPPRNHIILAEHVCRFFGCQYTRMLHGFLSIDKTWPTRESLDVIGTVKESMPKDAFRDLYRCLHFTDDWDEEDGVEWNDIYLDENHTFPELAWHLRKFGDVEDAFNNRWKECVTFGKWLTFEESRVGGWYHIPLICGPEPKPIHTGATINSL